MANQQHHTTTLTVLTQRNVGTWAWAIAIATVMNLMLFTIMPYLLHRKPDEHVYDQLRSHINVIRIKRPDSAVHKKAVKPPEPPKKIKAPASRSPARQPLQPKLTLPFEINPRLPGGPATLDLPPLKTAAIDIPGMQEAFGLDDLDGPLTSLGRIPPVYPMAAKRRGIQGWVKVKFVVNEQGAVEHITIVEAKPSGMFDQSVRRCVARWRFKPGTIEGLPVKAWVETTIRFELD